MEDLMACLDKEIARIKRLKLPGEDDALNVLTWLRLDLKGAKVPPEIYEQQVFYRKCLFSEYYHVSMDDVDRWRHMSPESRRTVWPEAHADGYVFRTLFDYNSYRDCFFIYAMLARDTDFSALHVLDFGCLSADYGYFFGLLGSYVTLCDFKPWADFAAYRLRRSGLPCDVVYAPSVYHEITGGQDMICFGEVLEHLKDPFLMLQCCVQHAVPVLYTSCYPYGDDAYFMRPGHTVEARQQAPACLDLLRTHFEEIAFVRHRRLWINKNAIDL
ncbi:MAG: hypothetical protein K6F98_00985 [Bacteroidales bacterium]|nr:hypothetical protein [Bacteroidales bacterium]